MCVCLIVIVNLAEDGFNVIRYSLIGLLLFDLLVKKKLSTFYVKKKIHGIASLILNSKNISLSLFCSKVIVQFGNISALYLIPIALSINYMLALQLRMTPTCKLIEIFAQTSFIFQNTHKLCYFQLSISQCPWSFLFD